MTTSVPPGLQKDNGTTTLSFRCNGKCAEDGVLVCPKASWYLHKDGTRMTICGPASLH